MHALVMHFTDYAFHGLSILLNNVGEEDTSGHQDMQPGLQLVGYASSTEDLS